MANVLHKTADPTQYLQSVNDPDYPTVDWFINPDISAVVAVPAKYWARPLTDPVTEMSAGEKTAVDDAEAAALVADNRAEAAVVPDDTQDAIGWQSRAHINNYNQRDNYLVNRIIELQNRVQAMLDSAGNLASMKSDGLAVSISATATRDRAAAIQSYKDDITSGGADT